MKKVVCVFTVCVLFCTLSIGANVSNNVANILAAKGGQYRKIISETRDLSPLQSKLQKLNNSREKQLLVKVIAARISHPKVFIELENLLQNLRDAEKHPEVLYCRGGSLSGWLTLFARTGPESKFVKIHASPKLTSMGWRSQAKTVEKYTDAEVCAGKARNKAARMALLEHLIKFSDEGNGYEQIELVDAIGTLWGYGRCPGRKSSEDSIDGGALLKMVSEDKRQPLPVRAAAIRNLPEDKRVGERELMQEILSSPAIYDSANHWEVFSQAVIYFKKNSPKTLKTIKPEAYWKKVIVNNAAGLPKPKRPAPKYNVNDIDIDFR